MSIPSKEIYPGGPVHSRRIRVSFEYEENGICIHEPDGGLSSIREGWEEILLAIDAGADAETLEIEEV